MKSNDEPVQESEQDPARTGEAHQQDQNELIDELSRAESLESQFEASDSLVEIQNDESGCLGSDLEALTISQLSGGVTTVPAWWQGGGGGSNSGFWRNMETQFNQAGGNFQADLGGVNPDNARVRAPLTYNGPGNNNIAARTMIQMRFSAYISQREGVTPNCLQTGMDRWVHIFIIETWFIMISLPTRRL